MSVEGGVFKGVEQHEKSKKKNEMCVVHRCYMFYIFHDYGSRNRIIKCILTLNALIATKVVSSAEMFKKPL